MLLTPHNGDTSAAVLHCLPCLSGLNKSLSDAGGWWLFTFLLGLTSPQSFVPSGGQDQGCCCCGGLQDLALQGAELHSNTFSASKTSSICSKVLPPWKAPESSFHFPYTISVINSKECLDAVSYVLKLDEEPAV